MLRSADGFTRSVSGHFGVPVQVILDNPNEKRYNIKSGDECVRSAVAYKRCDTLYRFRDSQNRSNDGNGCQHLYRAERKVSLEMPMEARLLAVLVYKLVGDVVFP